MALRLSSEPFIKYVGPNAADHPMGWMWTVRPSDSTTSWSAESLLSVDPCDATLGRLRSLAPAAVRRAWPIWPRFRAQRARALGLRLQRNGDRALLPD